MQHVGVDAEVREQSGLDRVRLRDDLRHMPLQQVPVDRMQESAADALLHLVARRERRRQSRPQIVVLPHRVVQPADVRGVADAKTRIAEADHLVDAAAVDMRDVDLQRRGVRRKQTSEPVIGRHDQMCVVTAAPRGLDERSRDDEVTAFNRWRARGDDGEDGHAPYSAGLPASARVQF